MYINPTTTIAWQQLLKHAEAIRHTHLKEWFLDTDRAQKMHVQIEDILFDYSKNRIDDKALQLLLQLAEEMQLSEAIAAYFEGEKINKTEDRAVLHTLLRNFEVPSENLAEAYKDVEAVRAKMKLFCNAVHQKKQKGYTGQPFTDVINIGIGGSDLGPKMVVEALNEYKKDVQCHFISNIDYDAVVAVLEQLNPETTLVVIVSKTFTTQETMINAERIQKWFLETMPQEAVQKHFVAVTANVPEAEKMGVIPEFIFPMWDWVGGRFSMWSAVGLSIALRVGYDHFEAFLKGAHAIDVHFKEAVASENIPILMGLLSIWNVNMLGASAKAVIPYAEGLSHFVPYLQQASMESNGKLADRNGVKVTYNTTPIIWGATGTNAQHAFFQQLHQGTSFCPIDFIVFSKTYYGGFEEHQHLLANCFAQSEALMLGKDDDNPYRYFEGNKPSNTFVLQQKTPQQLGALAALYEHQILVEGILWNIFSYDQFGVEYGKKLAQNTLKSLTQSTLQKHDASTRLLIDYVKDTNLL